jgi:hypothetical protein
MTIDHGKPMYYDGSGILKLLTKDYKEIIIKPNNELTFNGIPYFPYLNEKDLEEENGLTP